MGILLLLVNLIFNIFLTASACGKADISCPDYMISSIFPVNKASGLTLHVFPWGSIIPRPSEIPRLPADRVMRKYRLFSPRVIVAIYRFPSTFSSRLVSLIPQRYFMAQSLASLSLPGTQGNVLYLPLFNFNVYLWYIVIAVLSSLSMLYTFTF